MSARKKVRVTPTVEVNVYRVIADAVDSGIQFGLRRGDKHAADPLTDSQRERIREHVEREVMNAISEVLIFP